MSELLKPSAPIEISDGNWLVVCRLDKSTNKFIPLVDPKSTKIQPSKQDWTEAEDKLLEELILYKGSKKWTVISNRINEAFHNGTNFRQGKNCRERWLNHLDPCLKKTEWTPEEERILLESQVKFGNKWSVIAKLLPGRTENQVKNRLKSIYRKAAKTIRDSGNRVLVEWGGETGNGEGFDCGEVGGQVSEFICCAQENEECYFDYPDSPAFLY